LAATVIGLSLFSPSARSEDLVASALKFFLGTDSNTLSFDLDKSRPQPVTSEFKAMVVNFLPKEGRLTKLNELRRRKLDSLGAVLRLHQRESVYDFAVFESAPKPFAFIGLHQRAVFLISDAALDLLGADELKASLVHEIGHEYVWAEYLEAMKRNDDRRLKELELICDGVAILTLRRVGLGPAPMLTAAERITNFNLLSTGPSANAHRYPSADERRRFARAIVAWADSQEAFRPVVVAGMKAGHRRAERRVEQKVTVYVENDASVPSPLVSRARTIASEMFAGIGVQIDWRAGVPAEPQRLREKAIVVRLTLETPTGFRPTVGAFTIPTEGVHITVLYNRLAWSLAKPGLAPALLAHVLVHEITHILEGVGRHSETGVMQANWTSRDYYEMQTKNLPFTPEDIELINRGLNQWNAYSTIPVRAKAVPISTPAKDEN